MECCGNCRHYQDNYCNLMDDLVQQLDNCGMFDGDDKWAAFIVNIMRVYTNLVWKALLLRTYPSPLTVNTTSMMRVWEYARIHNRLQIHNPSQGLHEPTLSKTQETTTTNTNNHGWGTDMGIDPKIHYCMCGLTWTPRTYHRILMLLRGSYSRRCPQCHTKHTYQLMNHVVKINTEPIKNKGEVYKNG